MDEPVIRLLGSEAEPVILYDPIFPADPLALGGLIEGDNIALDTLR